MLTHTQQRILDNVTGRATTYRFLVPVRPTTAFNGIDNLLVTVTDEIHDYNYEARQGAWVRYGSAPQGHIRPVVDIYYPSGTRADVSREQHEQNITDLMRGQMAPPQMSIDPNTSRLLVDDSTTDREVIAATGGALTLERVESLWNQVYQPMDGPYPTATVQRAQTNNNYDLVHKATNN